MNQVLKDLSGKPKVNRYWAKSTAGEDIEVEDISDDKGFYTSRLLRFKDMFANGEERRTRSYHAECVNNPSSKLHKGTDPVKPYGYKRDILFGEKGSRSTGHLKDF